MADVHCTTDLRRSGVGHSGVGHCETGGAEPGLGRGGSPIGVFRPLESGDPRRSGLGDGQVCAADA